MCPRTHRSTAQMPREALFPSVGPVTLHARLGAGVPGDLQDCFSRLEIISLLTAPGPHLKFWLFNVGMRLAAVRFFNRPALAVYGPYRRTHRRLSQSPENSPPVPATGPSGRRSLRGAVCEASFP
jgi:hypothetical protein